MSEIHIHNGQVVNPAASPVQTEQAPAQVEELDPEKLAAKMAAVVSAGMGKRPAATPMEIVNELLQLKGPKGEKLVWTRFDVFQAFGIWTKKLSGTDRI